MYLPLVLFPILYIAVRVCIRCKPVSYSDMDYITGLKEIEEEANTETTPANAFERFWDRLVTFNSFDIYPRL